MGGNIRWENHREGYPLIAGSLTEFTFMPGAILARLHL
jgi:hypothetical protein